MNKIRKLFGEYNLTYKRLIVLAIISAIITAILNVIPFLKDTSFTDMAVNLDVWFLYALFIVSNSKNYKDAAFKCFLFFLISQPLIYLIEVPFSSQGFGLFRYYKYWFIITVLTLPGGAIAYLIKKKNWLSFIILAVPTVYLSYMSFYYVINNIDCFPRHALSAIFCIFLAIFFIVLFIDENKKRTILLAIIPLTVIICFAYQIMNNRSFERKIALPNGNWTCELSNDEYAEIINVSNDSLILKTKKSGYFEIKCLNENNEKKEMSVVIDGQNISVGEID